MTTLRLSAILLIFNTFCAMAQNEKSNIFTSLRTDYGKVTRTNVFLDGKNAAQHVFKTFSAHTAQLGLQTNGSKDWHHVHNFPQMGVGVQLTRLDYAEEIGRPFSVFAFYNGTFFRQQKHALRYSIDFGVATNWKPYNKDTNPYNVTIGSESTVHLSFGVEYAYRFAKQFEVGIGGAFTHFSNGALRKPNKGLNLLSPRLRLSYLLRETNLPVRRTDIDKPTGNEVFVAIGFGPKRYECDYKFFDDKTPENFDIYPSNAKFHSITLQTGFLHRYGHKGKYGGGVNLLYDTWMGAIIRARAGDAEIEMGNVSQRFALGLFAAHELCINRLSVVTQLGINVAEPKNLPDRKTRDFERMGVKYTFTEKVSAGVYIYAHRFSKADFIEWSIGYSLQLPKK